MPQLDPSVYVPQLVWLALIFVAMMFLMARVALPRVAAAIEQRRVQIDGDLDKAAALKHEIDIVIHAYERSLAEARIEANATINATNERLARIAAERQAEAVARIVKQTAEAEAKVLAAKNATLADLRTIAAEATKSAAERLLGATLDPAEVDAAVARVLEARA